MEDEAPALTCRDVRVSYDGTRVLDHLDLDVAQGETVALLGPSGSGKTTLLYAVAGFVTPHGGEIAIGGVTVHGGSRGVPPERRAVGLVFQNYALWPHLSAVETVAYPLRRGGTAAGRAHARARELLALMGVAELAERRPDQLSGGQQQRVGLARALAREATLYLLDEPTAHLDAPLRAALQGEIAALRDRTGAAALVATHDAGEALAVADRVALLRDGRFVQVGTPVEVYERPVDRWAAELTGPASVLEAAVLRCTGDTLTIRVGGGTLDVRVPTTPVPPTAGVRLLVRPDWVRVGQGGADGAVRRVAFHGPHSDVHLVTPAGALIARCLGPSALRPSERVRWSLARAWVLDGAASPATGDAASPFPG